MTRVFAETGEAIPVTVIQAGPCPVVAKRTVESNGYQALQVGFGEKPRGVNKPMKGHFESGEQSSVLDLLPGILASHGISSEASERLLRAFRDQESLLEALHELEGGE